jgi:fructosamine-3-kinase
MPELRHRIAAAIGSEPISTSRLTGGCIAEVWKVDLASGGSVVAKVARGGTLDIEASMLRYLAEHSRLPVPRVLHAEPSLLVIEHIDGHCRFSPEAERHAAELLADLHGVRAPAFGFERDTLIGPLRQPNPRTAHWTDFFRDHRLLSMAQVAADRNELPARTHDRLRRLAEALPRLITEPEHPALLHGDVWTTNVLAAGPRITAFLDPAIYWGDPEIELAFITLFGTFGSAFFERYGQLRPIRDGFLERRRDLYNLYPLLVHTALFGGGYAAQVESNLRRLGF